MEVFAGMLAYPVVEAGMRMASLFGEIGLVAFLLVILIASGALCVQPGRELPTCIATLMAPYLAWFAMFVALENSGIGNFVIEMGALVTIMFIACAVFRIAGTITKIRPWWFFYGPHFSLLLVAIVFRSFMPLVGK